jgi:hypothetical protein
MNSIPSNLTTRIGIVAITLFSSVLQGCSPAIKTSLQAGSPLPSHIALLPADYSVDIPRERIELVRTAVRSELQNQNFIVAEDAVVNSVCSTPSCPERSVLASRYLIDTFASLTIESFSKNNFLAGFYNQLTGTLSVADRSGKELIAVEYTESERGGLLFNSGQVVQGVISQVKNSGDAAYEELALDFAKAVVEQLPAPTETTANARQEGLEVELLDISAEWQTPSSYTVCAKGTPHSFASLLIGSNRTTLRETSPGLYCSAFSALVSSSPTAPTVVEIRSAFGNSQREEITLPVRSPCALTDRLRTTDSSVSVQCAMVGTDLSKVQVGCSSTVKVCKADKIVLFSAPSDAGPFSKVSESSATSAKLPSAAKNIHVIAIGPGGVPSLPVAVANQ